MFKSSFKLVSRFVIVFGIGFFWSSFCLGWSYLCFLHRQSLLGDLVTNERDRCPYVMGNLDLLVASKPQCLSWQYLLLQLRSPCQTWLHLTLSC